VHGGRRDPAAERRRAAEPYRPYHALFNMREVTKFAQDHADMDAGDTEIFLRLYHVNVGRSRSL